ncbi:MAG: hypothetical protein H6767_05225 [Candidatus Peribacteria bacterium]|nr:MAG: hypothetical protein H6767_05225 [Candidatus Peribacteria bacterium]
MGTMIGDPPNILIASASGYTFAEFLMYALPVVVVVWFVVMMMIRVMFRQEFQTPPKRAKVLMKMDENSVIKNQVVLTRSIWTLGIIIVLFFVHGLLHVPAAFIALFGAALLLLLVSPVYTMHSILKKTELTVLLFFASLFVLVGGLEQAGVLEYIATFIISGAEQHLILTALIILWVTAILSSILDNVPMTIAMVPVLAYLEASGVAGANLFWWALVFGVGF